MKKVLGILLTVLLLFTVVGCGKKKDPVVSSDPEAKQLYVDALAKNGEITDAHIKLDIIMVMKMEGFGSLDIISKTESWIRNSGNSDMEMIVISSAEVFGMSNTIKVYMKDGQYYLDDSIYQYKATEDEAASYVNSSQTTANYNLVEAASNFSAKKVDGGTEITFDVSKEALTKLLSGQLENETIEAAEFEEFSVKGFIDSDGYLKTMDIYVVFSVVENDITSNVTITMNLVSEPLSDSYTFEFPDFSEFSESNPILY